MCYGSIMVTYYNKKATPTLFQQNPVSSSVQKLKWLTFLKNVTNAFSVKNKHTRRQNNRKKNNYSINKFTSCIEDDNSTFQREELIVVLLIIHHDAPIQMYTKADECIYREN